jgi:hypothetical protein
MLYVRYARLTKTKPVRKTRARPLVREMLHKDYNHKGSVAEKKLWSLASKGLAQDEIIGGKSPVLK